MSFFESYRTLNPILIEPLEATSSNPTYRYGVLAPEYQATGSKNTISQPAPWQTANSLPSGSFFTCNDSGINSLNFTYLYCTLDKDCDVRYSYQLKNFVNLVDLVPSILAGNIPLVNVFYYKPGQIYSTIFATDESIDASTALELPPAKYRESQYSYYGYNKIYFGELAGYKEFEIQNLTFEPKLAEIAPDAKVGYDKRYLRTYPRPQFLFINRYYSFIDYKDSKLNAAFIINEGAPYLTDQISGQKPFDVSYQDFAREIRPYSINRTILPEYRISNHIEYFELEKGKNYLGRPDYNFLSLYGVDPAIKFNETDSGYVSSDNFNKFILDNRDKRDVYDSKKKIKITIDAILKLLPAKGFFPQERIVQITDLFRKSYLDIPSGSLLYGTDVSPHPSSNTEELEYTSAGTNGSTVDQHYNSLIQPFFAPGVLLNSIKSSIAVSWEAFISDEVAYHELISSNKIPYGFKAVNGYGTTDAVTLPQEVQESIDLLLGTAYIDKLNKKIDFEDILNIQGAFSDSEKRKNLYYLNPTYYTIFSSLVGQEPNSLVFPYYKFRYNENKYNKIFSENNSLYFKGISNFISEIPNFFLQSGELTQFRSSVDSDFNLVDSSKSYYMDVYLAKHDEFKTFWDPIPGEYKTLNRVSGTVGEASLYGPPVQILQDYSPASEQEPLRGNAALQTELAYTPYAPPYLYGTARARLKFTPSGTGTYKPTLSEILQNLEIEYINEGLDEKYMSFASASLDAPQLGDITESLSYKKRMDLSSCLYFDRYENLSNILSKDNANVDQFSSTDSNIWVIQTKFESPVINFNTAENYSALDEFRISNTANLPFGSGGTDTNLTTVAATVGLWSGYGIPPEQGKGIILGLEDSYDYKALGPSSASGSLIDLCKFTVEQKDIGLLSDKKEISEAIVLIPYVDNGNSTDDGYANATRGREIYGGDAHTCYFDIDIGILSDLLGRDYSRTSALEIVNILKTRNSEKLETNSILNLMTKMDKYILPPHLDWLHSKEIAPFAMYIIEFNHYLDREDLSNIWQGLSPKITNNAERKINSFEHDLDEKNLFHGKKIPEGTRFKIFRIKRRANADYKQITAKKHKKAKHIKEIQTTVIDPVQQDDLVYSYNWPYDFFSLIELSGISAEITMDELDTKKVDYSGFQGRAAIKK